MKTLNQITESVSQYAPILKKMHSPKHYKPEHADALRDYTESSRDTNDMLWEHHHNNKGKPYIPDQEDIEGDGGSHIHHLDNAIKSKLTPKPMTVYSGTKHDPRHMQKSGGMVHHPAYLSTSLDHKIAKNFAKMHGEEDVPDGDEDQHHHILKINVPKGHPHAYLENGITTNTNEEHEVLLPRALNLKHVKTTTKASIIRRPEKFGGSLTKYVHTHEMQLPDYDNPNKDPNQLRLPFKEKHMKETLLNSVLVEEFDPTKVKGLHQKLTNHYHKLNIRNEETKAVRQYTDDSTHINQYHWEKHHGTLSKDGFIHHSEYLDSLTKANSHKELEAKSSLIDNALNYHKTPHELTVYSGVQSDPRNRANNGMVHHPAYLSTSIRSKTAVGFARSNATEHGMHILKIKVPEGHPGAYVAHISHAPQEREFILPRGTNLKLTGHRAVTRPSRLFPGEGEVHHYHHATIVPKKEE